MSCYVEVVGVFCVFFFKQKTAYEMRISDWSSDVCSSDLFCVPNLASSHCWNAEFIVEGAAGALETISIILLLLLAVILSGILSRVVPQIGRASCRERVCQYV